MLGIRKALTLACAASAMVATALPALGLPDVGEYTEDRAAAVVVPAGDLDGDGHADTIATRQAKDAFVVEGRRGTDGARLWHHVLPGSVSASPSIWPGHQGLYSGQTSRGFVFPARVGTSGGDGVVVAHLVSTLAGAVVGGVAGAGSEQHEVRLSAIAGDGTRLWQRRFPIVLTPVAGLGFSDLAEPFDGVAGPAQDLAVAISTPGTTGSVVTVVVVLDGATGRDATRFPISWDRAATVAPVGDLDSDGLEDLAVTLAGEWPAIGGSVQGYSASRGARIWKTAVNGIDSEPEFAPLGDLTGDGVPELHIADQNDLVGYDDSGVLDGASGDWLTREPSSHLSLTAVPDLDGDGAVDLVEQQAGYRSVTYKATTVAGAPIYSSTYTVSESDSSFAFADVGDVNGDGVRDRLHTAYGGNSADTGTSTIVSLRTGEALWSGPAVRATGVSFDGSGIDLVRVASTDTSVTISGVDGATGAPAWSRTFASPDVGYPTVVAGFDPDDDGIGDVILHHLTYEPAPPWPLRPVIEYSTYGSLRYGSVVLAGGDGATRWQL